MKRIILSGCNGHMGQTIVSCAAAQDACTIVAGVDRETEARNGFPVFESPAQCNVEADVIIDFSHPSALPSLLAYATERKIPLVIATTGISEDGIRQIRESAKQIPIFFTANMSLGVNLMVALAKKAASVLGDSFDIEIVEKHHNQKIDAPSGTACMLADAVSEALTYPAQYVYDRHSVRRKRDKHEIGIHSIRGGTIVGEHDLIFAGNDEVLTISHAASSKKVFAEGAIRAALFLTEQPVGLYNMENMIELG